MDELRFNEVCDRVIHSDIKRSGIGTLSEKTIHAVLKSYYESDLRYHEVKVGNKVADVKKGSNIIEVQTRHFHKLREKLDEFLKEYMVTIVYPIASTKYICWIDKETGEVSEKRKSPKTGRPQLAFVELYKIKEYLKNPNLQVRIVLIDIIEYRFLDGFGKDKKKRATSNDKIPVKLVDEIAVDTTLDYQKLLPLGLDDVFTTKDFSKAAKVPLSVAQASVNVLSELRVIKMVGKKGRFKLYKKEVQTTLC